MIYKEGVEIGSSYCESLPVRRIKEPRYSLLMEFWAPGFCVALLEGTSADVFLAGAGNDGECMVTGPCATLPPDGVGVAGAAEGRGILAGVIRSVELDLSSAVTNAAGSELDWIATTDADAEEACGGEGPDCFVG